MSVTVADLKNIPGRTYPARRLTQPIVGSAGPLRSDRFALGHVTLEPRGGQVPWHNHAQEEVYFVIEGRGELCVGRERIEVGAGQAAHVPPGEFHQFTNIGETPLRFIYCYAPGGDVAHWRQELDGTLPRAGIDAPRLPDGAWPQKT